MEQATATEQAGPTPEGTTTDPFGDAHTIAGDVVTRLDQRPFAVETEEDFPSGWRVHLKFRESRAAGLLEMAALLDVPVTRANTEFGVHLDAYARIGGIEVRGSALVSPPQADELLHQTPQPDPIPTPQPVPLGASILAHTPALTPVPAPGGDQ